MMINLMFKIIRIQLTMVKKLSKSKLKKKPAKIISLRKGPSSHHINPIQKTTKKNIKSLSLTHSINQKMISQEKNGANDQFSKLKFLLNFNAAFVLKIYLIVLK